MHRLTEWLRIKQEGRQGRIISPHLFNVYSEASMRKAVSGFEEDVAVNGHPIADLRYADDIFLTAGNMEELQDLEDKVRLESESELLLSAKNTNEMRV